MMFNSGAKAQILERLYAALKGRSSTAGVLPQRLKPALIAAAIAGINACSTPRRVQQSWNLVTVGPMGVC
jgi:hypothetical protein